MNLRRRIGVLQLVGLALALAMLVTVAVGLRHAGDSMRRVNDIHGRFDALAELRAKFATYLEAISQVFLLGRDSMDGVRTIRIEIEQTLVQLTQATRDEISALTDRAEMEAQMPELEESRRLVELYHSIDASTNRALATLRGGDDASALATFQKDVVFRIDNEATPLLDHGMDSERAEIAGRLAAADALERWLLGAAGAVGVIGLVAVFVLGRQVQKGTEMPAAVLAGRARALSEGNLEGISGGRVETDEFKPLAEALDRTVSVLRDERSAAAAAKEQLRRDAESNTLQLSEANERLRTIDSRRAQFLADVSHQLRTPLTILRGEADVALRGSTGAEALRETLERIQGQAGELGDLLEELLVFARYEGESQTLDIADQRIADLAASAAREASVLAEPREVEIETRFNDQGCHLDADFRRLKQALVIGLDNAIKHSAPGDKVIVATARDADWVSVSILDHGPGIAPDEQVRVFDRFYRGRGEDDMQLSGLGIGLSIAKDIVERHGGTINLDNRPEGGADLTIRLPSKKRGPA